ncbi:MAG: YaeQ family protein [Gemmatimonadaceae bacterium]
MPTLLNRFCTPTPHEVKQMALTATIYNFDIQLANVDAQVYESLSLRVACHPSETPEYLLTRVLAYCLEYTEGIAFSRGLSDPDEPPIAVRDLTGTMKVWIEIGAPDAARLHKASKSSPRVVVYMHKDPMVLLRTWAAATIHRADKLELYAMDRDLLAELVPRLDRRTKFDLSVTDGALYIDMGGKSFTGTIERLTLAG